MAPPRPLSDRPWSRQQVVRLIDIAVLAQLLAANVEMPAARFQPGQGRQLTPGKPARRVLRGGDQQLPGSALNITSAP